MGGGVLPGVTRVYSGTLQDIRVCSPCVGIQSLRRKDPHPRGGGRPPPRTLKSEDLQILPEATGPGCETALSGIRPVWERRPGPTGVSSSGLSTPVCVRTGDGDEVRLTPTRKDDTELRAGRGLPGPSLCRHVTGESR